jgi:zinc protease
MVSAEIEPSRIDTFASDVAAIVADLRARPITSDELERARQPALESMRRARNSANAFWRANLADVLRSPEAAEHIVQGPRVVEELTADELLQHARRYLVDETRWMLKVLPRKAS